MSRVHTGRGRPSRTLDMVHIVIGIIIVVMAVFAFISPTENMVLFPLIFFTAAALKLTCGITAITDARREHERAVRLQGVLQLLAGLVILVIGVLSAVSVWY